MQAEREGMEGRLGLLGLAEPFLAQLGPPTSEAKIS